ncbi:MAG: group II intron reverse transcriptase/maturase [Clostridia bacterium]|nr:group II intron reverse transcriptase/maturase [Clostridia bacterium]
MVSGICGISYNISKANKTDGRVQNLAAHIDKETLRTIHRKMKPNKASGIDKVTKEEYDANLETNLDKLIDRMKRYVYRPNPSRRTYIPKSGSNKMRPLGISCYEDKLVENAIAQILIPIYEQKFITTSYGFRPNRNCHMAVREIIEMIQYRKVNYVVEADIRGFFDNVNHEWLMRMLAHDIADKRFLEIIQRFLKAGVMENGKYLDSEKGTPQGNGASPVLANIYLHYVLDLWFEKRVKNRTKGQCYLIRYADDFICCFQNKAEAERFQEELRERLRKFGLELAEEKTKIIEFGRFARENRRARGEGKPETFDFLGFTFYCGKANKKGFFRCRVRTSKKKYRSKIKAMKEWIKTHRTMPLKEMFEKLSSKLRGHYQYYGVTDNTKSIKSFYTQTQWLLYKWLNRRSQKRSYTTQTFFDGLLKTFILPEPKIYVSLFYRQVQI